MIFGHKRKPTCLNKSKFYYSKGSKTKHVQYYLIGLKYLICLMVWYSNAILNSTEIAGIWDSDSLVLALAMAILIRMSQHLLFKWGGFNLTYSPALRQPELYLLWWLCLKECRINIALNIKHKYQGIIEPDGEWTNSCWRLNGLPAHSPAVYTVLEYELRHPFKLRHCRRIGTINQSRSNVLCKFQIRYLTYCVFLFSGWREQAIEEGGNITYSNIWMPDKSGT